jgi:hypothetical protein
MAVQVLPDQASRNLLPVQSLPNQSDVAFNHPDGIANMCLRPAGRPFLMIAGISQSR